MNFFNKSNLLKYFFMLIGASALLVAFNNCGKSLYGLQGALGVGGTSLGSMSISCESEIIKVYKKTYHPFLNQTCNNCHVNGPGTGSFASSDLISSYNSFASIGANKINSQAINNGHKPPYTGSQNSARIDELKSYWAEAQNDYARCLTMQNPEVRNAKVVKSTEKNIPANLATTFVRMEWDLESESSANQVPLVASIEIRKAVLNSQTIGYEFRSPTLRLKNAGGSYVAKYLSIYINDTLANDLTTYRYLQAVISSVTDQNIAPNFANGFVMFTANSTDTIALEFADIRTSSPVVPPVVPPIVVPPTDPTVKALTYTQLTATGGILATSCIGCHNATRTDGGLNLASYTEAKANSDKIRNRVNNPDVPMPRSGLLPQAQRDAINAWVDQATPQ